MSNYPMGAKYDSRAPWNQPEPNVISVRVTLTSTFIAEVESLDPHDDIVDLVRDQVLSKEELVAIDCGEMILTVEEESCK